MRRVAIVFPPVESHRAGTRKVSVRALAFALFTAGALALAPSAAAQNAINWIGGTGNWDNASFWSTTSIPNSDTDVVTIGNTSTGNVTLDINATIGDLILNSGNILTLGAFTLTVQAGSGTNGTVTINSGGTLALSNGSVLTASGALTINSGGTLGLASGSTLTAGGALTNAGIANIGSSSITSAVTAGAGSLNNTGTLNLAGSDTVSTVVTTLSISGAGVNSSGGNVNLTGGAVLSIAGDYSNSGTTNVDNSPTPTGGSTLSIGGTLTNTSNVNIGSGNGNITSAATASVGALVNTGTLNVHGNVTGTSNVPATLDITGVAFNNGIPAQPFPAVNSGTVNLLSGALLSIAGNYGNFGTTNVDSSGDSSGGKLYSGGSTLSVTGVISNTGTSLSIGPDTISLSGSNGTLNLGNSGLTQPTEITAAGLNNFGTVNITGSPTARALLDLTGSASANPFLQPPAVVNAGIYNLTNDAELEYSGPGISGVGAGVTVNLNGSGASINATSLMPNTGSGVNSALNTLAGNAGTFELANGASVSTDSGINFLNTGTVDVDQTQAGGSTVGIGGMLQNGQGATFNIGNSAITKPTTVTSVFFSNYGTLNITGSSGTQALLDVTAQEFANPFLPASGALTSGTYNLTNDAEIEYLGPGIAAIGNGVTVNLNGANASINATNLAPNAASGTNSALNTLAANAGQFDLSNGGSLGTNAGLNLTNSGVMELDSSGQGGSTVSFGGAVTNSYSAALFIGNSNITNPTTVTVNGPLINDGSVSTPGPGNASIVLTGAANVQTTLNVAGAAPGTLIGNYSVSNDALLEYGSGGITTIAGVLGGGSGSLTLYGSNARVGLAGGTSSNSALTGLSDNGGSLTLGNGATVSTSAGLNFVNSGGVNVDAPNMGSGGSSLSIGGTIENVNGGALTVGNTGITSSSTLSAAGFALNALTASVSVAGENPGSGSNTAALILGNGITSISYHGSLTLSNSNSYVALSGTSPLSNNGLSGLASNAGTFTIQDGVNVSTNPGLDLTNDDTITVDAGALTSGSTSLNIGGVLDNNGVMQISNSGNIGSSTAAVTAVGLNNTGTINLVGATAGHTATLAVHGNVSTLGGVNVGSPSIGFGGNFATLAVAGGGSYTQIAGSGGGTTTVTGTLTAATVNVDSGMLQGAGTINGNVLNRGAMEGGITSTASGLAINGNYTQAGTGALYQVVNGISNGQFSSLNVHGNAILTGALDIGTPSGFTFTQGQTFDILDVTSTTGTVSGAFSGLEYKGQLASGPMLNIGGGLALDLTYNSNDVVLSVGSFVPSATADIWNTGAGTCSTADTSAWSAGAIPAPISDVTIGNSTGGIVTLDAGVSPVAVNTLTVTNGYTLSFGAASEDLTANASANIAAGGEIDIENGGDTLATGQGGSNGNLTNVGTLNAANGAALNVGGGGILTNAGTLSVQNGATLTVAGDFINGLPAGGYVVFGSTANTANFVAAGPSVISGNLTNYQDATLNIDNLSSRGGTTLTVSGTLNNAGTAQIGNSVLTSPSTVNAGNLINTGELTVWGASTQFFQPANVPAVLNIAGTWLPASGALDAGNYSLEGDAQIKYSGPGISGIGNQVVLLDGANTSINDTSLTPNTPSGGNSALNTLARNDGRVILSDGAQVQTNAGLNLISNGSLEVDTGGQGGSTLTIGGALIIEGGDLIVGSSGTVNVAGLTNLGAIELSGCLTAGCTGQGLLNVTGPAGSFIPASGALNQGTYQLDGNTEIAYSGPGITSLGTGVWLDLNGSNASIEATNLTPNNGSTNSAFNTLASNAGLMELNGGVSLATNPGLDLTNTGEIQMGGAATSGNPATDLTVGGTLVNSGVIDLGATLTAAGFSNNGYVLISGGTSTTALLDITGVAATNPFVSTSGALSSGYYGIEYGGQLEYTGPGITSIPSGTTVYLRDSNSSITATGLGTGTNNALSTLASNAGIVVLNGAVVSTTGNVLNTGQISVSGDEVYNGAFSPPTLDAGALNVGGILTNASNLSGQACATPNAQTNCGLEINNGYDSGTVTATGLVNSGTAAISGYATLSGGVTNSGTIGIYSGGQLSATGAFTNTNTGLLGIGQGAGTATSLISAAGFNNTGTVNIAAGNGSFYTPGTLTVTGSGNSYTQSGPLALTTVGGVLTAPAVNLNGGVLQGNGTITGNVVNGATIVATNAAAYSPAPGLLTINGNYTQTSAGVLDELVQNGVTRGTSYNAINVSGSVSLGGALDVTTLNGFSFAANQSYDLMNFSPGGLTGAFSTLEYNNLAASGSGTSPLDIGGGLALAVVYQNSTGEVLLDVSAQGPTTFDNWIGNTDVWSNGVNWSTGATPTPAQDVFVGTGSGGTVTYNVAASTINSLTVEPGTSNSGSALYVLGIDAGDTLNVTKVVSNSQVISLEASGASLTSGGDFTNSSLLYLANGGVVTVGSNSAPANFVNKGGVVVDQGLFNHSGSSTGGGSLAISGILNNTGSVVIGNDGITSQSTVSAASLSTTSGTTTLANALGGSIDIAGENPGVGSTPAVLQLGTSITSIDGTLTLANANSFITTDTSNFTNDGLSGLTSIASDGRLILAAGASATINGALSSSASGFDQSGNPFGIFLETTFFNSATSAYSDLATTLNVVGLANSGRITLSGCAAAGCTAQALLDVTGPAGSFVPAGGALNAGDYSLSGNSELEYAGPGITNIAQGVYVTLIGASASINATSLAPNNSLNNSAFNTLANNGGNLDVYGPSIATNAGLDLANTGTIDIDSGGRLTVGGALINSGGNISLGSAGIVVGTGVLSAASLSNTGVMLADGGVFGATTINGAANNTGMLDIGDTANVSGFFTNAASGSLGVGGRFFQGSFVGLSAGNLSVAGLSNAGEVGISAAPTGSLTITGSGNAYTQSGASATTLVEGTLTALAVNINGGLLQGNGLINGNVTNAAAVAGATGPSAPGLLTINGGYTQTSAASLNEIVQGASTRGTKFGAIDISGPAALAGALNVSTVNGFAFGANESFDIMNLAPNGLSGTFDTLQYNGQSISGTGLLNLGGNLALALAYEGSSGQVLLDVVTPDNWTGVSGNWSVGADWSGGVPGPTQLVNIGTGTGGTVTLDQTASVYNLNMEAGSSSGYTLAINPSETLTTAGTVNVGTGAEIDVEAGGAVLTAGGDFTNAGTLHLESGGVASIGTASEPRSFDNRGTIILDTALAGGSTLNISGTLSDTGGQITVGNTGVTSSATLSAAGFAGNTLTGVVHVVGSDTAGGAAATIELQNGITGIAANSDLLLLDANSQVNLSGAFGSNSALTGLTNVAGSLQLENGSQLSTNGDLNIASTGTVGVDEFLLTGGGSTLAVN